jgi:hypothetical protein
MVTLTGFAAKNIPVNKPKTNCATDDDNHHRSFFDKKTCCKILKKCPAFLQQRDRSAPAWN